MNEHNRIFGLMIALTAMVALPGCELVEGVFKVGMWMALIVVGLVVAAVFAVMRVAKGRSTRSSMS